MTTFITDAELKAWMNIPTATTTNDAAITAANLGATARIARLVRENIPKDANPTARYFEPLTNTTCPIDDAYQIDTVATDNADDGQWSTVWAAGDWFADPVGGIGPAGQTGWPYTSLVACESRWFFKVRRPYVKVTALWGWAAVPADITLAARLLGAELFKLHEAPLGTSWTADEGDMVVIRDNRPLRDLLQPYKLPRSADARFMVA